MGKGLSTVVIGGLSGLAAIASGFTTGGVLAAAVAGSYVGSNLEPSKYSSNYSSYK